MSIFNDSELARIKTEDSIDFISYINESKYHTKWTGYYRTYYAVASELFDSESFGSTLYEFKSTFRISRIVEHIFNVRGGNYTFDTKKVYMYADIPEDDPLFHHDYKEGIREFIYELKEAVDKERKLREDEKKRQEAAWAKASAIAEKHGRVVRF